MEHKYQSVQVTAEASPTWLAAAEIIQLVEEMRYSAIVTGLQQAAAVNRSAMQIQSTEQAPKKKRKENVFDHYYYITYCLYVCV